MNANHIRHPAVCPPSSSTQTNIRTSTTGHLNLIRRTSSYTHKAHKRTHTHSINPVVICFHLLSARTNRSVAAKHLQEVQEKHEANWGRTALGRSGTPVTGCCEESVWITAAWPANRWPSEDQGLSGLQVDTSASALQYHIKIRLQQTLMGTDDQSEPSHYIINIIII